MSALELRRALAERRLALVAWRLIVMQVAHPVVAAGMGEWSSYRAHPWRRVQHTLDSGRRLFFGDVEALRREAARLERSHRRIGVAALTVADLPPALRERLGLRRSRSAAALSWTLHHGARHLVKRLPDRRRYRGSLTGEGTSPARPPRRSRARRRDSRAARLDAFFRQVLDQTGDGRVGTADLRAMAHAVCWPLERPTGREDEGYA
ncbi:oxygenase MpaB family protein, partial [Streptomyces sp. DSM 44917]